MRGVRAVVRADYVMDCVNVWLLRDDYASAPHSARRPVLGSKVNAPLEWEPYEEGGTVPPPMLTLRPAEARALAEAFGDYLPPTAATETHLKDTVAVRDRLLALVEHTIRGDR